MDYTMGEYEGSLECPVRLVELEMHAGCSRHGSPQINTTDRNDWQTNLTLSSTLVFPFKTQVLDPDHN